MLNEQELDDAYTRTCHAMAELGEAKTPIYLARLSLLLMREVGDAGRIHAAIDGARDGLS